MSDTPTLESIVALSKRRGFVFPTSEIYGGLANTYDYGPLGAQLKKNIKDAWWRTFILNRDDMVGLDSSIFQHPQTWVASGHVSSFSDPLVEDLVTNKRYRADHLLKAWLSKHPQESTVKIDDLTITQMTELLKHHQILSPDGNPLSEPKNFNLLFETHIGAVTGSKSTVYLRGETAQGIFANFKQVLDTTRVQLPFGIGQIGKSFRNEITTGQFVFRMLEFEQAEIEYFFNPATSDWQSLFKSWQDDMWRFVTLNLGINASHLRWRQHSDKERSFYSQDTYDLQYHFPFGYDELWGIAYRSDYDLKQHIKHSGAKLEYRDPQTGQVLVPHVIEPAVGLDRLFLMVLVDAYTPDPENNRLVLKLAPSLAPYQVAVFPLLKNKPDLVAKARAVYNFISQIYPSIWDDRGNIGKRYLYQDEIGTPFCLTIDFDSLKDNSLTVRHRDSTKQERVSINSLDTYLKSHLQ